MVSAAVISIGNTKFFPRQPRKKNEWQGVSIRERRSWMKGMFFYYPEVKKVIADALENIEGSFDSEQSIAMHIVAESGAGKTTLVDELEYLVLQAYDRDDPEKTIKPVLRLEAPSPCTPTELCYSILEALGDPNARSRGKTDQTRKLKSVTAEFLNQCEVRVILFDNFQDIPSARRARGIEQVGIRLRDLIDMTRCTWIFLGTKESREVVNAKSQLIKRVAYEKELRYFSLEGNASKDFVRLLQRFDEWLPLAMSSFDVLQVNAGLIYIATAGILDRLTKLLDKSWYYAANAGRESLIKSDLFEGFQQVFGPDRENPFSESFVIRYLDRAYEPYEKFGFSRCGESKQTNSK